MSKTLTITLPDALEQALVQTAAQANQSTEEMVVQLLTQTLMPNSESKLEQADPLMALFGSIKSDVPDLAERHDEYLGQALYEEMYRNE
ncbi:MAG: hypothetical protein HC879_07780 [Leptolyngbyaceae cyanobacterium SL_5_9]|nr:hypothetical protein [Leptolyngbyaceae cyanobacterium SL_5_9]NJO73572.1 hypothetical protein [Leptolyngbyaceae cyanobacterium RM1_406_9]